MKKNIIFLMLLLLEGNIFWAQANYSDCSSALIICSKGDYTFQEFTGPGANENEVLKKSCMGEFFEEKNSAWIKWEIESPGQLEFDLIPLNLNDDLDFVLYRIDKGSQECFSSRSIRCVASGKNLGAVEKEYKSCLGPTGIKKDDKEVVENKGCDRNDNNYVAPIYVQAGDNYALFVHNYSSSSGVIFELRGTAELKLERDLTIDFDKNSTEESYTFYSSIGGGTVRGSQYWNFGKNATPAFAEGKGPHVVRYKSAGIKTIETTIETEEGCMLSAIKQVDALPNLNSVTSPDNDLEVFPNPISAKASLQLKNNKIGKWANFHIVDVLGRIHLSHHLFIGTTPTEIDLTPLDAGAYFIKLETDEKNYLKKIIKQ